MKRTNLLIGFIFLVFVMLALGCATPFEMAQVSQKAGKAAYKRGDYKGAIENYKKAISQDPASSSKSTWRYNNLGDAYFKNGNYQEALKAYKQCLEGTYKDKLWDKYPDYRGNRLLDVRKCYEALKDYRGAVSFMEQLIAKDPNNYNYFRELGYMYVLVGQYDKGIAATKRAIELHPQDAGPYNNLGYAYGKKKEYDDAFKAFRKSIALNPKNYGAYSNMASLMSGCRYYTEAAEAYKKAVELQPANVIYLMNLANTYRLMGRYDDAMIPVNKAIKMQTISGIGIGIAIESDSPTVKTVMETGPAKKSDVQIGDKIIKVYSKSTKGWNAKQVAQNIKGASGTQVTLTIERKNVSNPVEKLVVRETIHNKTAAASFAIRGFVHRYKGEKEKFLKDAEKAYSLDSTNDWAIISLGASYLDQGRYDEGFKLLSRIKKGTQTDILEATAYAKKGDFKKAINIYSAIPETELSPKDVPLWNDRTTLLKTLKPYIVSKMESAGSLRTQGRYKEALKELGDALKVSDDQESKKILSTMSAIMETNPKLSELPEEARKYALMGDMLTKQGKFADAAKEYRKAVQAAPYIASLCLNTAMIYGELKRYPQAIHFMKTYLQLAPKAPNARAAKDQIYKWEFMMGEGK